MLYQIHEWQRTLLGPLSRVARTSAQMLNETGSPLSHWPGAQRMAAGCELLYRLGKAYEKPAFNIDSVRVREQEVAVIERVDLDTPFCQLKRFKRFSDDAVTAARMKQDPVVLVVAPLAGHHATLLRDTVRTLLGGHEVYITDWVDACMVPVEAGPFRLDDYVRLIERFITHIGADSLHVICVCQPTVPVLVAVSLMAMDAQTTPRSLTMMGGPIDPRRNPTQVNNLATTHSLSWFKSHMIHAVPFNYPGHGREVYPGFLQHASFMAMNPGRHLKSHWDFYLHLLRGDQEDAEVHRRFYDEYNAVLDMPAGFYLDTIADVFQQCLLPRGLWEVDGTKVNPAAITRGSLLTIEGEFDDIAGLGQTRAAHDLCTGLPGSRHQHLMIEGVGHYGIFTGRRWREIIYPQVRDFIARAECDQTGCDQA